MAKAHDRILEFNIALVAAADTLEVTSAKFYRDRGQLAAGTGFTLTISGGAAGTSPKEVEFGELAPPPTHARFVFAAF